MYQIYVSRNAILQKITATQFSQVFFTFYLPKECSGKRILKFAFQLNPQEPPFSTQVEKPQGVVSSHSFVQIVKKYLLNQRVKSFSVSSNFHFYVIEFTSKHEDGPQFLLFDFNEKIRRISLARFHWEIPDRYQKDASQLTSCYESFSEWTSTNMKTKRRLFSQDFIVEYCPLVPPDVHDDQDNSTQSLPGSEHKLTPAQGDDPFSRVPKNIRDALRGKIRFFEKKIKNIESDLASTQEIDDLKKNADEILYFEKQGEALQKIYKKIHKLKTRKVQAAQRLQKTKDDFQQWKNKVFSADGSLAPLNDLLKILGQTQKIPAKKNIEKEVRSFYRELKLNSDFTVRISRTAPDGDAMVKLMPSHHYWLHILNQEGSHVWLVPQNKKAAPSQTQLRQASILAIHYSKMSKSMSGEVQITKRMNIEKRKTLPPGKVIVKSAQTLFVSYSKAELESILHSGEKI